MRALAIAAFALGCVETSTGVVDGAAVYQQHCDACHGGEGRGIDSVAPPLRSLDGAYARSVVRAGRDELEAFTIAMPAFDTARLPDPALDAILDYLESFDP